MKRTLLFVATGFLLVTTTGCLDQVLQKCKDIFSGASSCTGCCGEDESSHKQGRAGRHSHDHKHAIEKAYVSKTISAEDLKNQMEVDATLVVINVLAKEYYDDCHIIGSVNMPLAHLDEQIGGIEKDAPIVVYCAHAKCNASAKAAQRLAQLGYTNVKMYEEGMKGWLAEGYSYDGPAEMDYLELEK